MSGPSGFSSAGEFLCFACNRGIEWEFRVGAPGSDDNDMEFLPCRGKGGNERCDVMAHTLKRDWTCPNCGQVIVVSWKLKGLDPVPNNQYQFQSSSGHSHDNLTTEQKLREHEAWWHGTSVANLEKEAVDHGHGGGKNHQNEGFRFSNDVEGSDLGHWKKERVELQPYRAAGFAQRPDAVCDSGNKGKGTFGTAAVNLKKRASASLKQAPSSFGVAGVSAHPKPPPPVGGVANKNGLTGNVPANGDGEVHIQGHNGNQSVVVEERLVSKKVLREDCVRKLFELDSKSQDVHGVIKEEGAEGENKTNKDMGEQEQEKLMEEGDKAEVKTETKRSPRYTKSERKRIERRRDKGIFPPDDYDSAEGEEIIDIKWGSDCDSSSSEDDYSSNESS